MYGAWTSVACAAIQLHKSGRARNVEKARQADAWAIACSFNVFLCQLVNVALLAVELVHIAMCVDCRQTLRVFDHPLVGAHRTSLGYKVALALFATVCLFAQD